MVSSPNAINLSIINSLNEVNKEVENLWVSLMELTKEININDHGIPLRRLISYNPLHNKLNEDRDIKSAIEAIIQMIQTTIKYIQKEPENNKNWIILGHCYLTLNDMPNAYSSYVHALKLNKHEDDPYFLYGIGCVYLHFKFVISKEFLERALKAEIHSKDLYLRYAISLRRCNDFEQSITCFENLLNDLPLSLSKDDIRFQIAYTYQLSGQNEKAFSLYKELYAKYPMNLILIQQFSWFLSLSNDNKYYDFAIQIIQDTYPNDPILLLVYAKIAMKKNDMVIAYQKYCKCILYWSDSPMFWCVLGILYLKNDQKDDAVVAFQRALCFKADLQEAWINLGIIYEMLNEPQNALKVYHAGIQSCPDSTQLKDRYNSIRNLKIRPINTQNLVIAEINDSKLFIQAAERAANQYVFDPPDFPVEVFSSNDKFAEEISNLRFEHISNFKE